MNAIEKWQGATAPVPVIPRKRPPRPTLRPRTQPAALLGQIRASLGQGRESGKPLGEALDIRQVAEMLGCSPWTVRQQLLPQGLPHLRFTASGKLHFYKEQVTRWVEQQQGGI